MQYMISQDVHSLGKAAAEKGGSLIKEAIRRKGSATIVLATGMSQVATLKALIETRDIDWSVVTAFHLDEYVGIDANHPASFRRYLRERFVEKAPGLRAFHFVDGSSPDPAEECARLNRLIAEHPVDVAFIGIGENAHLAFNDPPADFETTVPFIVVELTDSCRRQQVGEGWFDSEADVPTHAISMSIQQIMDAGHLIVSAPDRRKADAVRCAIEGPIVNSCPASILQQHDSCYLFLDPESASSLSD
ncbi:MAG: glucosamine-6-phosphate deaminase [Spirochaetaceae bacterium]